MSKLSVVIPVYNRCDYVKVMIDSIINQTYKDWELFLIDDGSDDETIMMMLAFTEQDDRINLIRRNIEPKGAQTCRNLGFDVSDSEFVMFLDSDDYIQPFCFEKRMEFIENRKNLCFAVFPYVSFKEKLDNSNFLMCGGVRTTDNDLSHFLIGSIPFVVWNNIYRCSSLKEHSIVWDDNILSLQDADFNMQCILSGLTYDYAADYNYKPDYYFRQSNDNNRISMKIMTLAHAESHLYFANKTLQCIPDTWKGNNSKYVRWCLVHKFLLLKDVQKERWLSKLYGIAELNHCKGSLKFVILVYEFLSAKIHLSTRIAKNIAFFNYFMEYKRDRRNRKEKISNLMKEVL